MPKLTKIIFIFIITLLTLFSYTNCSPSGGGGGSSSINPIDNSNQNGNDDNSDLNNPPKEMTPAELKQAAEAYGYLIYFDYQSSSLTDDAKKTLDAWAKYLVADSDRINYIRIEGHTDERGMREDNMTLGEACANSAKDYLSLQLPYSLFIESVSFGEEAPLSRGHTEEDYKLNRRAEIKIYYK